LIFFWLNNLDLLGEVCVPVLMCRPVFFNVNYTINPWMQGQLGKVNQLLALEQWEKLFDSISRVTAVYLIPAAAEVPDLVFTANAGAIFKHTAILSRFRFPQRQPEESFFKIWFESKGFTVCQPTNKFEGEGDLLKDSQGRFWLGTGFRTDSETAQELSEIFKKPINKLELVDPRWYHLDTCFCPLSGGELLWWPAAFSQNSQELIRSCFDRTIETSFEDAESFACNAVCIDHHIFVPKSPETELKLNNFGYKVNSFELGEFQKSGGSAKCLTLQF
jgi:N-dimethylarginine dimethylaminohydrolase